MGRISETPRELPKRNDYGDTTQLPDNMLSNANVRRRMDDPKYAIDRGVPQGEKMKPIGDLSSKIAQHRMAANQTPVAHFKDLNNPNRIAAKEYEQDRNKTIYNLNHRA